MTKERIESEANELIEMIKQGMNDYRFCKDKARKAYLKNNICYNKGRLQTLGWLAVEMNYFDLGEKIYRINSYDLSIIEV